MNYNGWKDTLECLESLFKQDYPNYKIIVIDNHSTDNSVDKIIDWAEGKIEASKSIDMLSHLTSPAVPKPIKYKLLTTQKLNDKIDNKSCIDENLSLLLIANHENRGFSAGNNVGLKFISSRNEESYIWLINNDTVVESNALSELVKCANNYTSKKEKVGLIGAKLRYYHKPNTIQGIGGKFNYWLATSTHIGVCKIDANQYDDSRYVEKIDYPIGASLFFSKAYIEDVGLMCEDYFLYFEEIDWVLRGKKKGWGIGYCWNAIVFHKEGGSIGSHQQADKKSILSDYCALKGRITFMKKFYPFRSWIVKLSFILVVFNRLRRCQFERIGMIIRLVFNIKHS
nr:glycosyltransferase family 2 protein [Brenneria tiliae]